MTGRDSLNRPLCQPTWGWRRGRWSDGRLVATAAPSAADALDGRSLQLSMAIRMVRTFLPSSVRDIVGTADAVRASDLDSTPCASAHAPTRRVSRWRSPGTSVIGECGCSHAPQASSPTSSPTSSSISSWIRHGCACRRSSRTAIVGGVVRTISVHQANQRAGHWWTGPVGTGLRGCAGSAPSCDRTTSTRRPHRPKRLPSSSRTIDCGEHATHIARRTQRRARAPCSARAPWRRARKAVGHSILIAAWHILHGDVTYNELGGDYFEQRQDPQRTARRKLNELRSLGFTITTNPDGTTTITPAA